MPLLPPRVVGPISECNQGPGAVWIQGHLIGATVEILADGNSNPVDSVRRLPVDWSPWLALIFVLSWVVLR